MPIMTTLVTGLGVAPSEEASRRYGRPSRAISSSRRLATQSWPRISATARSRLNPERPVEQKPQSSAQPTCEDTHSVPRSSSGMKTVSMPLPMPTSKSHFTVPSDERCSERTAGARTSAICRSFSRSPFARSVIASKSSTPRWCTQRNTCFARNGFSPSDANQSVRAGSVKSRRLVRMGLRARLLSGSRRGSRGRSRRSRPRPFPARPSRARHWRRSNRRNRRGSCPSRPSSGRWRP